MEGTAQGTSKDASSEQSLPPLAKTPTKDYQDLAESRDSKLKAIWDGEMGELNNSTVSYRKAFVLLLSWDIKIDDLHTGEEVTSLDKLFREKFNYETVRKVLIRDPRRTAQVQVNRYLAEFVDDHDDTNTLLIIYYAGHGRPGESPGSLKLTGSRCLRPEEQNELHEIVWSSAEHNIKDTRGDVLVIFDCCHAGELERNVRSNFTRRAFEFLAATSAKSTTRKPGPYSFTSALIWSLSHLVDQQGAFSTQELLRTILNDAPTFPTDQSPRLSERKPASLRKIVLAPLSSDAVRGSLENTETEEENDISDETRQDLTVRFVFNKEITDEMVKELANELGRLVRESSVKAKTVVWEGIDLTRPSQFKDSIAQLYAHRWLNAALRQRRNKSIQASPTNEAAPPQISKPKSTQDSGLVSGPPSIDDSVIATPDAGKSIQEANIGDDQGSPETKAMVQTLPGDDQDDPSIKTSKDSGARVSTTPRKRKRDPSVSRDSSNIEPIKTRSQKDL